VLGGHAQRIACQLPGRGKRRECSATAQTRKVSFIALQSMSTRGTGAHRQSRYDAKLNPMYAGAAVPLSSPELLDTPDAANV
jgi:hypothetical protein